MEFLEKLFGEDTLSYNEFVEKLDGKRLLVNDGTYISKSRFDEVNNQKNEFATRIKEMEEANMSEEEKRQRQIEEANEIKSKYQLELSKLKASELFVKSEIEDYEDMLELVVSEDIERTEQLAQRQISRIVAERQKIEDKLKKQYLESTPKPNTGGENPISNNPFSKDGFNLTKQAELLQKDPEMYAKYKSQGVK